MSEPIAVGTVFENYELALESINSYSLASEFKFVRVRTARRPDGSFKRVYFKCDR